MAATPKACEVAEHLGECERAKLHWLRCLEYAYRSEDGQVRKWDVVERCRPKVADGSSTFDCVEIIARCDGDVLLVRQYRPPVRAYVLELPAGVVDAGESAAVAALRELEEETGYSGGTVSWVSPPLPYEAGMLSSRATLVCVDLPAAAAAGAQRPDDDEFISVRRCPAAALAAECAAATARGDLVAPMLWALAHAAAALPAADAAAAAAAAAAAVAKLPSDAISAPLPPSATGRRVASGGAPPHVGGGGEDVVFVSFDVDGTLLRQGSNAFHEHCFTQGIQEVTGMAGVSIQEVPHHGMTDSAIIAKLLTFRGVPPGEVAAAVPAVVAAMGRCALAMEAAGEVASLESALLPGVRCVLAKLRAMYPRVLVGLVTGNCEPIAWAKAAAMGIVPLLSPDRIGAFGSEASCRTLLVRRAAARASAWAAARGGRVVRRVHVGDAPSDVAAAVGAGAVAVGVLTGSFTAAQLVETADGAGVVIFPSMENEDAVVAAICGTPPPQQPAVE